MLKEHDGKDYEIGRVVAGIAWPGEKPGFVVFIGEELNPRMGEKVRRCHLLEEAEDVDLGNLLRRSVDTIANLRNNYNQRVEAFIGRKDERSMSFLYLWCQKNRRDLFISYAPHCDDGLIAYHINGLQERAKDGTLHLPKGYKLKGYMDELKESEINSATDSEFPAVAALGYAVSYLTLYEPDIYDDDEEDYIPENDGRDPLTGY
jgi:hypothetical protein